MMMYQVVGSRPGVLSVAFDSSLTETKENTTTYIFLMIYIYIYLTCDDLVLYLILLGPATVRMISENGPAFPLPLHLPPGHMVQQVLDENGVLTHVIMSQPAPPPPPSAPHHHVVRDKTILSH